MRQLIFKIILFFRGKKKTKLALKIVLYIFAIAYILFAFFKLINPIVFLFASILNSVTYAFTNYQAISLAITIALITITGNAFIKIYELVRQNKKNLYDQRKITYMNIVKKISAFYHLSIEDKIIIKEKFKDYILEGNEEFSIYASDLVINAFKEYISFIQMISFSEIDVEKYKNYQIVWNEKLSIFIETIRRDLKIKPYRKILIFNVKDFAILVNNSQYDKPKGELFLNDNLDLADYFNG